MLLPLTGQRTYLFHRINLQEEMVEPSFLDLMISLILFVDYITEKYQKIKITGLIRINSNYNLGFRPLIV